MRAAGVEQRDEVAFGTRAATTSTRPRDVVRTVRRGTPRLLGTRPATGVEARPLAQITAKPVSEHPLDHLLERLRVGAAGRGGFRGRRGRFDRRDA